MSRPINFINSEISGKIILDSKSAKKYFLLNTEFKFKKIGDDLKNAINSDVDKLVFKNKLLQEMFELITGKSFYVFEHCIEGPEKGKQIIEKVNKIISNLNFSNMAIHLLATKDNSFSQEEGKNLRESLPFKRENSPIVLSILPKGTKRDDAVYLFVMIMMPEGIF